MTPSNPATGERLPPIDETPAIRVAETYELAKVAQRQWAQRPFSERAACLEEFRRALGHEAEALGAVLTEEMGKPLAHAIGEIRATDARLAYFLKEVPRLLEPVAAGDPDRNPVELVRYEPLGIVANISAWNFPYFVGLNVIAPALLTGNAVLYKPSEITSRTGEAIGRLLHGAGVPEDVFHVLPGAGETGRAILDLPVDGVFFTGSRKTGVAIHSALAGRLTRVQLELGGKDPVYVHDDVDVASAAASVAEGAFFNAGQSCCAVERIYVAEGIAEQFVAAFVEEVRGLKVGDPTDSETTLGPLAREPQLAVLEDQIRDAKEKGAQVLVGGGKLDRPGFYFEPTVLVRVDGSMKVMREETFGPVIGIQVVSGPDQALKEMADTEYGLTAGVFSKDQAVADSILAELAVGSAYWNCCDRVSPRLPWSGRKGSGVGATLGHEGIRAFLVPKAYHLRRA